MEQIWSKYEKKYTDRIMSSTHVHDVPVISEAESIAAVQVVQPSELHASDNGRIKDMAKQEKKEKT